MLTLTQAMDSLPLVAILRGITPDEVVAFGESLVAQGYKVIEVPLNSPNPYDSIKRLSQALAGKAIVGAGTVITLEQVDQVKAAGGQIIISPHANPELIRYSKQQGMYCVPGFVTPTEAFAAIDAGADALKLFPANVLGPEGLKAIVTVLPEIDILPVGGVSPSNMQEYLQAGAKGFGLGSGLYKAGMPLSEMTKYAQDYVSVVR